MTHFWKERPQLRGGELSESFDKPQRPSQTRECNKRRSRKRQPTKTEMARHEVAASEAVGLLAARRVVRPLGPLGFHLRHFALFMAMRGTRKALSHCALPGRSQILSKRNLSRLRARITTFREFRHSPKHENIFRESLQKYFEISLVFCNFLTTFASDLLRVEGIFLSDRRDSVFIESSNLNTGKSKGGRETNPETARRHVDSRMSWRFSSRKVFPSMTFVRTEEIASTTVIPFTRCSESREQGEWAVRRGNSCLPTR